MAVRQRQRARSRSGPRAAPRARHEPYEMLLSESQERMILCARPTAWRGSVRSAPSGARFRGGRCGDGHGPLGGARTPGYDPLDAEPGVPSAVPVCDLAGGATDRCGTKVQRPMADDGHPAVREVAKRRASAPPSSRSRHRGPTSRAAARVAERRLQGLGWRQYDHIVRGAPAFGRARMRPSYGLPCQRGSAASTSSWRLPGCPEPLVRARSVSRGALSVAEACRNLVCAGAEPIGLSDCLNFGSPERPE